MLGAGSAGIGVADYLRAAMVQDGLSEDEARSRFWLVDKDGLLHSGRTDLTPEQRVYAQPAERVSGLAANLQWQHIGLADVIGKIEATVLIGLSTVGGAFTESIVREMARKVERPIIFPLSNPTTRSEAKAEDLIRWTDGRALVATGSPFAPVQLQRAHDSDRTVQQRLHLPGHGTGSGRVWRPRVTDAMMLAAARALAGNSPALKDSSASLLPPLTDIRRVAAEIAIAAGIEAQKDGVAPKLPEDELRRRVMAAQWNPAYSALG